MKWAGNLKWNQQKNLRYFFGVNEKREMAVLKCSRLHTKKK